MFGTKFSYKVFELNSIERFDFGFKERRSNVDTMTQKAKEQDWIDKNTDSLLMLLYNETLQYEIHMKRSLRHNCY